MKNFLTYLILLLATGACSELGLPSRPHCGGVNYGRFQSTIPKGTYKLTTAGTSAGMTIVLPSLTLEVGDTRVVIQSESGLLEDEYEIVERIPSEF